MTSKEILQHIKNAPSFKGGDNRYMSTSNSAFLYDQDVDAIEKDLEVLEILKKIVKIVDYSECPIDSPDNQLVILSGGRIMNVGDYDKIKRWLNK